MAGDNQVTNDHHVTAEAGSHQTVIRIEQPKESPWKQPAVYVAILALIVAIWANYSKAQAIEDIKDDNRIYRNDISMWETDVFNRDKTIDAYLEATGVDTSRFPKIKPPPER